VMCGVVGALSAFYHDSTDINDPYQRMVASYRLIAKMPTIAAMAFKYSLGQPFVYPKNSLGYAENFMHMAFSVPCEPYDVNPVVAKAMDQIFILHADHEQNASTATVRNAGSSGANPFACIAAGIASLWGPAHGGANEAVLKMLARIGDKSHIKEFLDHVKDKNDDELLFGFGHRVYKNYDPRAHVLRESCHDVLRELGIKDEPLLDLAPQLVEHRRGGARQRVRAHPDHVAGAEPLGHLARCGTFGRIVGDCVGPKLAVLERRLPGAHTPRLLGTDGAVASQILLPVVRTAGFDMDRFQSGRPLPGALWK